MSLTRLLSNPRGDGRWLVVALLFLVVLIPSATVLWLTAAAASNERAAHRQRLDQAYRSQLRLAAAQVKTHWERIDLICASMAESARGQELFAACVDLGIADSVLIVDEDGGLLYPAVVRRELVDSMNETAWRAANRLEFVEQRLAVAAESYAAIAEVEPNVNAEARAWTAVARCLQKDSQVTRAIGVLTGQLDQEELRVAVDQAGRSLWLDAQLRALQLMSESGSVVGQDINTQRAKVRAALEDYRLPIPSPQRQFVMLEFSKLFEDAVEFPTLAAEQLASQYRRRSQDGQSTSNQIWNLAQDPRCVVLKRAPIILIYEEESLDHTIAELLKDWHTADVTPVLVPADESAQALDAIATVPLSSMPGHSLALMPTDPLGRDESAGQRTALYTLAGLLTIAIAAVVAIIIAVLVGRQLKLAQLKNDLAAVVAHELRTPVASVRVLVDTLLANEPPSQQRTAEYLQLIAMENERLSRLIENFLTFARLQRGHQQLALDQVWPATLCERAIASSGDKLRSEGCHFEFKIAENLPSIRADEDAMLIVLMNLLDNAVKFSGDGAAIQLTATQDDPFVAFEVVDNGIGMTPADKRRAFQQYYQADMHLARNHGGCGLGLSLVQSIVEKHGGTIDVESTVGKGSAFTVRIPQASVPSESSTAVGSGEQEMLAS